jgi:hypothetical protein
MTSGTIRQRLAGAPKPQAFDAVADGWFEIFFGKDAPSFMPLLHRMRARTGRRWSVIEWSWSAALLPIPWLLYRKLWSMAALLLFGLVLPSLVPISAGVAIGATIGTSLSFRSLYVAEAGRTIAAILAEEGENEEAAQRIARAGGVSIGAGILGLLAYATGIVTLLGALVADLAQ